MARHSFKLPDIGEGIAEAEIVAWHKAVGDRVEEDDPLCDMMTDKATVEMTAPVSGTLAEVAGEVGDQVAIGSVLAVFESEDGATAEAPTVQVAPPEAGAVALSEPVEEANGSEKPSSLQGRGLGEGTSEASAPPELQPTPLAAGRAGQGHRHAPPHRGEYGRLEACHPAFHLCRGI